MASYLLSKRNIKYKTLTPAHDIDNEKEEKYFELQVKWLKTLDNQFSKWFTTFSDGIKHYWLFQIHWVKVIMDTLPIRAWQFNKIIREENPTDVYLYTYLNRLKTSCPPSINFIGEPSASELVLSEAAKQYSFNIEIIKSMVIENNLQPHKQIKQSFTEKANKIIDHLYRLNERISGISSYIRNNDNTLSVLAQQNGYDIPDILSRIRSKGHTTYVFNNLSLYQYDGIFNVKEIYSIKGDEFKCEIEKQRKILENIIDELDKYGWYLQWYDEFSGLPMSKHLIPRLKEFVMENFSKIITYEKYCKSILTDFRIDYLITSSLSSYSDFGFALASKEIGKAKSVALMHGNTWLKTKLWDYTELYPFNIYFAPDSEIALYLKKRTKELKFKTEVYEGTGRFPKNTLKQLSRFIYAKYLYRLRLHKLFNKPNLPTVVYVPTFYMGDRRIMNYPYYTDTWYFELQKAIVTSFSKQNKFNFIVKILKGGDSVQNPIQQLINDQQSGNIVLRDDPFYCWLFNAELFIFDSPSTALYEVMSSKKQYYVLLPDEISIRESISKYIYDTIPQHVGIFHEIQEIDLLISKLLNTYKNNGKISYISSKVDNIVSILENRQVS